MKLVIYLHLGRDCLHDVAVSDLGLMWKLFHVVMDLMVHVGASRGFVTGRTPLLTADCVVVMGGVPLSLCDLCDMGRVPLLATSSRVCVCP
jgi:hypothetical protein